MKNWTWPNFTLENSFLAFSHFWRGDSVCVHIKHKNKCKITAAQNVFYDLKKKKI